jgi:hypothetical protein
MFVTVNINGIGPKIFIMYYHAIFNASHCNDSLDITIEQKVKYIFSLVAMLQFYIIYKDCPTSRRLLFQDTLL